MPKTEYSAGGVAIRDGEVLLIQVENMQGNLVWTFPKGHVEKGERSAEAALREVEEETGFRCRIVRELAPTAYWYHQQGQLVKKIVRWYVMTPEAEVGTHDREVSQVQWVPLAEALNRLTYPSDRELLQKISESPAVTS